jgi:hypothetical protein
VYDSKEFTGNSKLLEERAAQIFYKISQKTANHLHSLGVLHPKKTIAKPGGHRGSSVLVRYIFDDGTNKENRV